MLLLLVVYCCIGLSICEDDFGGSIAAIGPDTLGFFGRYKSALTNARLNYRDGFNVTDYISLKGLIHGIERDMLVRYKEVNATLFSTSRFYYNYRHVGNVAAVEATIQQYGLVPRKQSISLIPETCLCHPTNAHPGRIYVDKSVDMTDYKNDIRYDKGNMFLEDMYIAYRSMAVRLHNLRYVMSHRFPKKYPISSRVSVKYRVDIESVDKQYDLPSHFVYMTGHGGDRYFQFQAKDVIAASDIEMYVKEFIVKHPNVHSFLVTDTCEASTLFERLPKESPMIWMASSSRGVSSYSYNSNRQLTVSTVGKFTYYVTGFIKGVIRGIKARGDRASISRLSLFQLKRHMMRHCPEELPVFHANSSIVENQQSIIDQSHGNDIQEYTIDLRKVYLGEFLFNYRLAYFNDYRWPLYTQTNGARGEGLQPNRGNSMDHGSKLTNFVDSSILRTKMGDSGLLVTSVQEGSRVITGILVSICIGAIMLAAVCDPLTMGNVFVSNANV
ncbi:Peptidase C13 family protein [Babesia bovis T2Bo]|uniref:GPI-anchor transamidase n=1 Tax=Babesia bovis TaxID=5865 RepID=A7AX41_BABBO|nr:Peptidase C13 family protein [Babesia bovis T2Bo]EDO05114.1 Peptidase C13 family protein [Babesia bovis T2Bo]|eukprot:XP_001608682.1 hypothetical protein [Babesia bovis T2Bo]